VLPEVFGEKKCTGPSLINIISKVLARVHGIINMADDGGLTYLRWRQQSLYHRRTPPVWYLLSRLERPQEELLLQATYMS